MSIVSLAELRQHTNAIRKPIVVHFREVNKDDVRFTLSRAKFSEDEPQSMWYNRREIKQIAKQNRPLIKKICRENYTLSDPYNWIHTNVAKGQLCQSILKAESIAMQFGETVQGLENLVSNSHRKVSGSTEKM